MNEKRFEITEYGSDYYIEIIDKEKELDESIPNPSQKLSLIECVDLLNEQQSKIRELEEEKMELEKKLEFKTLKQEEKDKQIEEDYARLQRRKILERSGNCEPLTLKYNPNTTYRI